MYFPPLNPLDDSHSGSQATTTPLAIVRLLAVSNNHQGHPDSYQQ